MNCDLGLRYQQLKENDPTDKEPLSENVLKAYDEFYQEKSHSRNICFVLLEGRRIFMNYNYLISGEYVPADNAIILSFTTHIVAIEGVNLDSLFYNIMNQTSKQITCMDNRYNVTGDNEFFVVNMISIKSDKTI